MAAIDRRRALKIVLVGAAASTLGAALASSEAEAIPLDRCPAREGDAFVAQWHGSPAWGRPRRRRWVCWWRRGRRICEWRWV